jgi:uncharacterized membrane protein YfcA
LPAGFQPAGARASDGAMMLVLLFLVALIAGMQNALAGGGSFLTFPMLLVFGMGARAANITSTVALFPGQLTSGYMGRSQVQGTAGLSFRALAGLSLVGGGIGAVLLLATPESVFQLLVPFLVLFATAVFAWRTFGRAGDGPPLSPRMAASAQMLISIYGGYFGGGIGILMLSALVLAGLPMRAAGATKNALAGVINAAAVVIFAFSHDVHWMLALVLAIGSIIGGQLGAWMLLRVNERLLQYAVVGIGAALTIAMFVRAYA